MVEGAYKKLAEMMGGKSRKENDLIVDLDSICSAITGKSAHSDHEKVLDIALKIRNELYKAIESYAGSWENAYIISASSDKKAINDLKRRFDAEEHRMEATKDQCIDRIQNDPDRKGREQIYIDLVEKWFSNMAE